MAFKMKGNPMHRNFGIGAPTKKTSAYKDQGDHNHPHGETDSRLDPKEKEIERESVYNQAGMGKAYDKRRGSEKVLENLTKSYEIGSNETRDTLRDEGKTAEYNEKLQKSKGAMGLLDDLANYEETSLGVSKSKQQQAKRKLEKARAQADSPVKKKTRADRIRGRKGGTVKNVTERLDEGDYRSASLERRGNVAASKGKKTKAKKLRRKAEKSSQKFFEKQVQRSKEK